MKIYKTQAEIEADIKDGVLVVDGDVKFECSFSIEAKIVVRGNINAWNIDAWDIDAWDINAWNINAWNINAWDINAWNINAGNIDAWNIDAWNIDAENILYHAFCCAYQSIKCLSIKAKREKHQKPICLEGKVEIKKN